MPLLGKYFPYDKEHQLEGIFNFYNHIIEKTPFSIEASTHVNCQQYGPIEITRRNNSNFIYWSSADNEPNITFHFDYPILLTSYVIENPPGENGGAHSYPEAFIVSGSNDNSTWNVIDEQSGVNFCNSTGGWCYKSSNISFTIKYPEYFTHIRFTNINNSVPNRTNGGGNAILMRSIEFFGEIKFKLICTSQAVINRNYYSGILIAIALF